MSDIVESNGSVAIRQIDASNAFNSLNRNECLHKIKIICPEIFNFFINCYNFLLRLVLRGKGEFSSQEGTRNDHLAMELYVLDIIPLTTAAISTSEQEHQIPNNTFYKVTFADAFTKSVDPKSRCFKILKAIS